MVITILLILSVKRVPFYEGAKRLFALGSIGQFDLVTSSLSIVNTIYIGRKYELPIVKQRIKSILSFVTVCDLQADVVIKSLDSDWQDYEDSVQSMTAMDTFADCIVTRNKKDFRKSVIPVYTIEELMSLM